MRMINRKIRLRFRANARVRVSVEFTARVKVNEKKRLVSDQEQHGSIRPG